MLKKIVKLVVLIIAFLITTNVDALDIKVDTNKIYFLNDADKEFVTMPSSYKTQAQITVTGASDVTFTSTDTSDMSKIQVDSNGIVTISPEYCTPGAIITCTNAPNNNLLKYYDEKKVNIIVSTGGVDYNVEIESIDYSRVYIDEFFDSIIKKYPPSDSTEKGRIQPILDWISQETDYSAQYSYTKDMIFHKAGDCWASSRVIVDFAKKQGLNAVVRTKAKYADIGVGSGHENVYAELDGIGYVIDAGFNEEKPRRTIFARTDNGWYSGGLNYTIGSDYTSYNGFAKNVSIPENSVITGLGKRTLYYGFSEKTQIETLHIPKTITNITPGALMDVPTLKVITVASDNPTYSTFDDSLFSKDKKTLISIPGGKELNKFQVYDFVETIDSYAISYNDSLEELIIPNGVKTLKESAIVGNHNLKYIDVAESVETIEQSAVAYQGQDYTIIRNKNANITSLPCSMSTTLFANRNSTTEAYATANNCNFTALEDINFDTDNIKKITKDNIRVEDATYTGEPIIPNYTVTVDGKVLTENKDFYIEEFKRNTNAGIAEFVLNGMGKYVGRVYVTFNINRKEVTWEYLNPIVDYNGLPQSPQVVVNDPYFKGIIRYGEHPSSSNQQEKMEYTNPGEYRLGINISGDYNYKLVSEYITFKIKGIDISNAQIENIDNYTYTDTREYLNEINNKKVTLNGKELIKDTDYTTKITTVGKDENNNNIYKLTVTGKGLYEGTATSNGFIIATKYNLLTNYEEGQFIKPNDSFQLIITSSIGLPLEQSYFKYKNYNEDIVSIDENGKITALKEGTATIYITSTNTYNKSIYLTIKVANERIPMEVMTLTRGISKTEIEVGSTIKVYGYFYPSDTTDSKTMTYKSSDESILTVDQNGTVTGLKEGIAFVTATTKNGLTDTIKIVVGNNPESVPLKSISLQNYKSNIEVGDIYKDLRIGYNPSDTTINKKLTYRSSDTTVATIDESGIITGIKEGTTYIIINANKEYSQVFKLTVNPKKSVTLENTNIELEGNTSLGNNTYQLNPILNNISGKAYYKSSNNNVATVNSDGLITAQNAGDAIITVTVSSYKVECNVKVVVNPTSIIPNKETISLEEGSSETININYNPTNTSIKELIWNSSDESIATVDSKGKITAKKKGNAIITAITKNNKKAQIMVNVKEKEILPTAMTISSQTNTLSVGDTITLTPKFAPTNTNVKDVSWNSSNTNIATVDDNGLVTGIKEGDVTITATTKNNIKATINLTIKKKAVLATKIEINPSSIEIEEKETIKIIPIFYPENTTNKTIIWESGDNNIVTVSNDGTLTAIKPGSTTVTAKTNNNKTASCKVTVKKASIKVKYKTHVQTYGWQEYVKNGEMSGTSGEAKRLEGIKIKLENLDEGKTGNIEYRTHIQTYGWEKEFKKNDEMSGTSGEAKRLEAIEIKLTGDIANDFDVYYRVHAQTFGWLGWARNGEPAGTAAYAKRLEAIEIKLVPKGELVEGYGEIDAFKDRNTPESISLNKTNISIEAGDTIKLIAEVLPADITNKEVVWASDNEDIVTVDQTGEITAITTGTTTVTATTTNGKTTTCNVNVLSPISGVAYKTHVQSYGWQEYVSNGEMSGTSGEAKRLEAIQIKLKNQPFDGDIEYRTHIQTYGWEKEFKKNDDMSGTSGEAKRLEAIEIRLTGEMAEHYDIYYRVHAQSYGWLNWAKNGERAGTAGFAKRLEGIEIVLVDKGQSPPVRENQNNELAFIQNNA